MGGIELQKFHEGSTLCERRGKSEERSDRRHKIGGLQRAVDNHSFANAGAQDHHPGGARESIARAVMLKSVAAGIVVGVAAKVRQDEDGGIAGVLRLALN